MRNLKDDNKELDTELFYSLLKVSKFTEAKMKYSMPTLMHDKVFG